MDLINQSASKEPREMRLSPALQSAARYSSPFVRFVLATPLHRIMSSRLMLLRFTGRKTGRYYTTPVSYVLDGNSLLVPAGGAWRRNLEAGPQASVRLRGVWRSVTSEVVGEPALADLLLAMIQKNPAIGVFTGIRVRSDGQLDASAFERERRRGFVVVRLRLDEDPGRARTAAA